MDAELILRQAQDKNTPPEILTELAHNQDREIRRCIAKSPNTSAKILADLCIEFPDEVAANPIYDLLRAENKERKFSILSSAKFSAISAEKLIELANQRDVIILDALILNNPKTSGKTIDKIFDSDGRRLSWRLFVEHKNTKNITLEKIVTSHGYRGKVSYEGKNIHYRIIEHPNASIDTINISKLQCGDLIISPCILEKLSNHEDCYIRALVSRHHNTSTKTLNKLSLDDVGQAPEFVAKHRNTSKNILLSLAKNENERVRRVVAQRINLSSEIANILSKDAASVVRSDLARNSKTPTKILDYLVEDSSHYVREAVAGRKDISLENAMMLAHDILWQVIEKLASNTNVSATFAELFNTLKASRQNRRFSNKPIHINFYSIQKYLTILPTISIPEKNCRENDYSQICFCQTLACNESKYIN